MQKNGLANEIHFFKSVKSYMWYFLLLCIVLSLGMTGTISGFHILAIAVVPGMLYLSEIVYFNNLTISRSQFLTRTFFISLIVKIAAVLIGAFILYHYSGKPFLSYNDDYVYNEAAKRLVNRWRMQGIGFYTDMRYSTGAYSGYPNFSAFLMYIFGKSYIIPRLGNAFISSLSILYVFKIINLNYQEKHARLVTVFFALSPIFIVYSALQLKDTVLIFCLLGLIYYLCLIINKRINIKNFVFTVVFSFLMFFFRPATLLPLFAGFIVMFFIETKNLKKGILRYSSLFALPLILLMIFFVWQWSSEFGLIISASDYFKTRFGVRFGTAALAGSKSVISGTSIAQILSAPLYMVFSIFLPIPQAVPLPGVKLVNYHFIPLIHVYSFLPFAILALKRVIKKFRIYPTALFLSLFMIFYKLGQASSLSIFDSRQSLPALAILYLLLPVMIVDLNKQNSMLIKTTLVICTILIFMYAFVRYYIRYAI